MDNFVIVLAGRNFTFLCKVGGFLAFLGSGSYLSLILTLSRYKSRNSNLGGFGGKKVQVRDLVRLFNKDGKCFKKKKKSTLQNTFS